MSAEVRPAGYFLLQELIHRKWTTKGFAEVSGIDLNTVDGILDTRRRVTPPIASKIGRTLGTSGLLWVRLDEQFWSALESDLNTTTQEAAS